MKAIVTRKVRGRESNLCVKQQDVEGLLALTPGHLQGLPPHPHPLGLRLPGVAHAKPLIHESLTNVAGSGLGSEIKAWMKFS